MKFNTLPEATATTRRSLMPPSFLDVLVISFWTRCHRGDRAGQPPRGNDASTADIAFGSSRKPMPINHGVAVRNGDISEWSVSRRKLRAWLAWLCRLVKRTGVLDDAGNCWACGSGTLVGAFGSCNARITDARSEKMPRKNNGKYHLYFVDERIRC
jgi:hypothetical protein